MSVENFDDKRKQQNRQNAFVRTALIVSLILIAAIDVVLWIFDSRPDNVVVLVALFPVILAVFIAFMGHTNRAIWIFAAAVLGTELYLALTNPQNPMELDALIGRYLFPLIFLIPIILIGVKDKSTRTILIVVTAAISAFNPFWGYIKDPIASKSNNLVFVSILYGIIIIAAAGILITGIRNFTGIWGRFSNLSLRYKLTVFVLLLLIPTVIISGLETARQAAVQIENNNQDILRESHQGLMQASEIWLEENIHFLQAVAQFPEIVSMDPDQQKPILVAVAQNNPHIFLFQTTNTRGFNVARNDNQELKNYSDREWYLKPMAGEELTLQSLISRTIGEPALVVSVPIRENNGSIVGVLQMGLEFSELTKAIGATEVGETGVSYIVDINNTLIAHNDQSYFELDELVDFSMDPAVDALRSGQTGIIHYIDENGAERMAYIDTLDEYGWGIVINVDEAEVQAPVVQMKNGTYTGFVLILIPAIALLWFVLGRTVKPIVNLTEITQQYAEGQIDVRAEVKSEDEVGTLSSAFNRMADQVSSQTLALQERAKEMEASQRVTFAASERTTPDDFLELLVNLLVDQFDIYHAQVYLVDEARENAVLSQSTGYAGRVLLQRKHNILLERESLVTRCINTGESVLVANTLEEAGWLSNELLPHTQSELVVPLKVEGKVIGALDIQDRVAGRFTDATVPVFESMTEQVAFLYQNNELLQEIEASHSDQERFAKQLATAAFIANQLGSILDLDQLLDQAVTMLQSQFNLYHAHIYLLNEAEEKLVVQAGSGHVGLILRDRGHNIPVDAEQSLVARTYRDRVPTLVEDVTQAEGHMPNPLLPDTRSELAVPLISRGKVIGVLDIQDETVGRFTDVDANTMNTLAVQMATAIENAQLFRQAEKAAEQERVRYEIASALSGDLSADEVWDVLIEKAKGENLSVALSRADQLPDGDIQLTVVRSVSTDPGITAAPIGYSVRMSENPALSYLKPGKWLLSNDVKTDERFNPEIREYLVSSGMVSGISALLALNEDDEWQGMLRVSSREPNYFDEDKTSMYNSLIELGTIELEAANLREQTESERKRFETLITYAPDAILMLDYENYMFTDANRNAEAMFGMTRDELLSIGPGHVSPSHQPDGRESGEKAVEMITNAVTGGNTQFEWVHTNKDGEEFNCEIRLALLPGDEKQLLVNITDITDRKQAQDAIIEGDKLKSEFLANMSHELRTPLNSIVGYTDVLLMGVDGELNDEMLLDVQAIQENSALLLGIINDILDLAKIEAKRVIFEVSEVDVKDVLDNVVRNNAGLLVNKPVEMKVNAVPNLPKMEVDPMRVEQVLNNLVSNAVKFTEEGHITLHAYKEEDMMVMQVEDTGAGISKDDLQTIFEEFRQADGSQTRTVEGTGLGLTITRRLVHMHNGTIDVESEVGKGSTFTVRLPIEANISPEVTVKKVEKKDAKPAPAKKVTAPKAEATEPAPKAETKASNGKAKGNSTKSLEKAAELFADELKETVAEPDAKKPEDSKAAAKKESSEGKNGTKEK